MTDTLSVPLPQVRYDHLHHLSGRLGIYEHARYRTPRRHLGYTTDDNARALVVLRYATQPDEQALLEKAKDYVLAARGPHGWHNRRSENGRWADTFGSDDSIGRVIWGLGCLAGTDPRVDRALRDLFRFESTHPRANAYATLGGVKAMPHLPEAEGAVVKFSARLPRPGRGAWRWPAPALTYANPRIPQALIEAGVALEDCERLDAGLELLEWLIEVERGDNGFSFTPVSGRRQGDTGPGFDQQPIEAWSMVDACNSARRADSGQIWVDSLVDAALWFLGKNDIGVALYEEETGAGFDGLTPDGVNRNRGAESTLAALSAIRTLEETLGMSRVS